MPRDVFFDATLPLGFDYSVSGFVYINQNAAGSRFFWHFVARTLKYGIPKTITDISNFKAMRNFIEDYLVNPSLAIEAAQKAPMSWAENLDEEMIFRQLASPEFSLYEEIVMTPSSEDLTFASKNIYL